MRVYTKLTGQPAYAMAIGGGTYARAIKDAVAFGAVFPKTGTGPSEGRIHRN